MPTIYKQRVEAGALIFNVPGSLPAPAISCGIDVLDGWKSSPEPEVIATDFGVLRDGMELGQVFPIRARYLVVGGWGLGASDAGAEMVHDTIARDAFPRDKLLKMVRYEAVPKYVWYRRSAALETDWEAVPNGFRWNTTLVCADPFKYSVAQQVGSAGTAGMSETGVSFPITFPMSFSTVSAGASVTVVSLYNEGTAPSRSYTAVLTGPLSSGGWRVRNDTTNEEIWFDVGAAVGDTVTLDFRAQQVYVNGFAYTGRKSGDWFALQPGQNDIRLYADFNINTTITVTAESAWE